MKKAQPTPLERGRDYTVKSVVKALNILELLAEGELPAYTLTELSHHLGLHITTVHRLVANLVRQGFVEEAPGTGGYQLSFRVLRMGLGVLNRLDFRQVAEPLLEKLTRETQEAVHLAILEETGALVVASYPSPQPGGPDVRLGDIAPLHCSGVGKALLAYQPRSPLGPIVRAAGFPHYTRKTITNLAGLRKELELVREQRYALDQEETLEGLIGVAGPVFDHTGHAVAAFSVAGPATRLSAERVPEIARLVCAASDQISYRLGYRPGRRQAGRRIGR
ncbi:MAG: IclR family transcriptional regulator [Terriglobia bacterium]|jgi:IclR family acetate operon transcriptional repressor